jgi:hypothetical protein
MNSEHASAGRRLLGVRYTDPKMFAEGRKEARHRGGSAGPRFWEPGAGCAWEQVSTAGLVLDVNARHKVSLRDTSHGLRGLWSWHVRLYGHQTIPLNTHSFFCVSHASIASIIEDCKGGPCLWSRERSLRQLGCRTRCHRSLIFSQFWSWKFEIRVWLGLSPWLADRCLFSSLAVWGDGTQGLAHARLILYY